MSTYPKLAQLKTVAAFRDRLCQLQLDLPVDDRPLSAAEGSPLAAPLQLGPHRLGNRWVIHPMEGWDANSDGSPSEQTLRRWQNFGRSGAKLIWGGEAAAVQPDGRANPHQTLATEDNRSGLRQLLATLLDAHQHTTGDTADLLVGLQLTHSGRFCRPLDHTLRPRIAYHHPLLDEKFCIDPHDDSVVWTDDDLERLMDSYVRAAQLAADVGFHFVDVKACHGYLLHEFLSARTRPGRFGGDLAGRSRLLRTIVQRIRDQVPQISVLVRLSVFDTIPYQSGLSIGRPMTWNESEYTFGFGVDPCDPTQLDLTEPIALMRQLQALGVTAINVTAGSPYYNPHVQRPAIFPPSDGYLPPEDPLVGVVRQIQAARACKQALPKLALVGTGYSYLQDYLPHVAQAVVRAGWIDMVGLGRMVLSYPELPRDVLQHGRWQRKKVCRTFSDCTTAPRHGLISGCFPLDPYYKVMDEAETLRQIKSATPSRQSP
jgi:NADPH2 dehydrogenase